MKTKIILIVLTASILTACTSTNLFKASDDIRCETSWSAFCATRGHDRNDTASAIVDEYLDTWCGSVEEEKALIKAGVEAE